MGCCDPDRTNPQECCEPCEAFCPCIAGYPQIWTVFLLLFSGGLLVAIPGLYAFISLRTSIFRFEWPRPWLLYINASVLALLATGLFLVLCAIIWCACRSPGPGLTMKAFFLIILFITAAASIAGGTGAALVYTGINKSKGEFATTLENVWMIEVKNSTRKLACKLQRQLKCRGFEDGDCRGERNGNKTRCAEGCSASASAEPANGLRYPGCRFRISNFYRRWNLILMIGCLVAGALAIAAFVITTTTVSFHLARQKGNV